MAVIISDRLTDTPGTAVESHTPNIGGPWVKIFNDARINAAGTGVVTPDTADDHYSPFLSTQDSAGDDQQVTGIMRTGASISAFGTFYLMLRNKPDDSYRYEFGYTSSVGWFIAKVVSGSRTVLDTESATLTADTEYTLVATAVGTALELTVDAVSTCTATDADVSGSDKRRVGFRLDQADASGLPEGSQFQLMDFIGEDAGGTPPVEVFVRRPYRR